MRQLKRYAKEQYTYHIDARKTNMGHLLRAVPTICDSLPEPDATLRKPLVDVIARDFLRLFGQYGIPDDRLEEIALKELRDAVSCNAVFAADLVEGLLKRVWSVSSGVEIPLVGKMCTGCADIRLRAFRMDKDHERFCKECLNEHAWAEWTAFKQASTCTKPHSTPVSRGASDDSDDYVALD